MHLYVGTSGFAYKEWEGPFYPPDIGDKDRLRWYAERFNAVEINSTFYRFPTSANLSAWATQVPKTFRFGIKVPRRITHTKRLLGVDEDLRYLIDTINTLGPRRGPVLFQLPPRLALDMESLGDIVAQLPPALRATFEFRHASWFSEEVYELLRDNNCALCFNDETMAALRPTAEWGYLRLRRGDYTETQLAVLAEQVLGQHWREAYVFFKHESADAPRLARRWMEIASGLGSSVRP